MSRRYPEPRWFVGDPTSLARDTILTPVFVAHDLNTKVYDLRTQSLNFVAPIPEQMGTTTMHFPEVGRSRPRLYRNALFVKGPTNFRS